MNSSRDGVCLSTQGRTLVLFRTDEQFVHRNVLIGDLSLQIKTRETHDDGMITAYRAVLQSQQ